MKTTQTGNTNLRGPNAFVLFYCFRICVNLFAGISVKQRTNVLRKEQEEGVVRGGEDHPIAKQKKLYLTSQQYCFLLSVLMLPYTAATGDALNHCCWGVVLIPKEEKNIGVSR